jgi:signal transduction histidine kinase
VVVSSELVDTNALLERLLLLLGKRLRDQGITIERDLNPDLPLIRGRSDDLTQVFLNLLVNAIEATPNGGTIRVHTLVNQENTPQEEVIATISDTGSGISPDLQARIFEPFVTTKASSTGLGLSISIQIIRQHHGTVTITSEPGQGSTFMVSLPGATAVSGEGS